MANLVCPTHGKDYVLPTKAWLEPLNEIIAQDVSTRGKMIISKMLKEHKILVKLTTGNNDHIKKFIMETKGLPNLVNTYCVLLCQDDFLLIKSQRQFCSLETKDENEYKDYIKRLPKAKNYNYAVTLELMENYTKGSMYNLNNIPYARFLDILFQLIFCQLNIFGKAGYTHNDFHAGNILIKKYETPQIFVYKHIKLNCLNKTKKEYTLESKYEYILADYDKIFYFRKGFFDKYYGEVSNDLDESRYLEYSLYQNLLTTINVLINKLNEEDKMKVRNKLNSIQSKHEGEILKWNKKLVIKYSEDGNFEEFINKILKLNCHFVKKFIQEL